MAIQQRTRAQIRRDIGYLIAGRDKFAVGAALAATANTVTLDVATRWADDYYKGAVLYVATGAGAGQVREILSHVQSSGLLTTSANWTVTPSVSDVIEIWPAGSDVDAINNNINLAIRRASDIAKIYTEANFSSINSDYMYATLPTNMTHVAGVFYYENTIFYDWYHESWLDSQGHGGFVIRGRKLYFNRALSSSVGDANIFVQGYRLPLELDDDAAISEVRPDYVALMAAFYTEAGEAQGQQLDPEQHGGRAGQWLKDAIAIESRMMPNWLPTTVEVPG